MTNCNLQWRGCPAGQEAQRVTNVRGLTSLHLYVSCATLCGICYTASFVASGAAALQAKRQTKRVQIRRTSGSIRRLSMTFSGALPRGVPFGPLSPSRAAARAAGIADRASRGAVGGGTWSQGRRGAPVGVFCSACPAVARVAWCLPLRGVRGRQAIAPTGGLLHNRSNGGAVKM